MIGRHLLRLAAASLLLVTAAIWLARYWWAFDLLSHFRLQYVILGGVLCLMALAWRSYAAAAVLGFTAAVHGWAIRDLWLGGRSGTVVGAPVRVAAANVLNSNPTPDKVLEFVRVSRPDLLLVIDAEGGRWREVMGKLAEQYEHRAPEDWRDGAPVILFSRLPIVAQAEKKPPVGSRPYLIAEVAIDGGTIRVVGVHPTAPSPTQASDSRLRNWQFDHVAADLADAERPLIVAGDFNSSPWSPHFGDFLARTGLRNAAEGQGWIATWPSWFWPARVPIDHVLIGGTFGVESLSRGPFIGSDHYPVIADLRVPLSE